MGCKPMHINKFLSLLGVSLGGSLSFGAICAHRGDETFYSKLLMPVVSRVVDPELAHEACIFLTKHQLIRCKDDISPDKAARLQTKLLNMSFQNPIGVAAGFDKNSEAVAGLGHYGLGFAEVGTVTPRAQPGNEKKRIFRLNDQGAIINRCGFNNKGIDSVADNLTKNGPYKPMIVGLNLGKNKDTNHLSEDYIKGLEKAKEIETVDYIVINISSPNTPGLRDSQEKSNLGILLDDILTKMDALSIQKPLFVKMAPDLSEDQLRDIAGVIQAKKKGSKKVDGVILTNTTVTRPDECDQIKEIGGLSGRPLRDMSTRTIRRFYQLTNGKVPIIGVGGVFSGQDAYEKIRAGASLVQLYTGLTYEGPPIVNKIKRELAELLELDGIQSVSEAVGLDSHKR